MKVQRKVYVTNHITYAYLYVLLIPYVCPYPGQHSPVPSIHQL